MSKHLSFPAAMLPAVCQRCGNRLQRDERCCSQCGAFRAAMPDVTHGDQIDRRPAPLTVVEGPWPVRQAPNAEAPDEDGRYFLQPAAPVPLMKRTLSVRTTIMVACAVAVIACGATYLLYRTTHKSVYSSEESISTSRSDSAPNPDAGADVSYMNQKALREIDAQLAGTTSAAAPTPTTDDPLATEAAPTPAPPEPDSPAARAPVAANPTTMTAGIIQKGPENMPASETLGLVSPQQPASNPTFPDARDPNALERAIRQYGWKTPIATKSSP